MIKMATTRVLNQIRTAALVASCLRVALPVTMYIIKVSPSAPALLAYLYPANPRILLWLRVVVSGASGLKRALGLHALLSLVYMRQLLERLRVLTMGPWDSLIMSVQL